MSIEDCAHNFLKRIGSKFGESIWVDDATSTVYKGTYARLCIEVESQKPLVSKFKLKRRIRRLEYEREAFILL